MAYIECTCGYWKETPNDCRAEDHNCVHDCLSEFIASMCRAKDHNVLLLPNEAPSCPGCENNTRIVKIQYGSTTYFCRECRMPFENTPKL